MGNKTNDSSEVRYLMFDTNAYVYYALVPHPDPSLDKHRQTVVTYYEKSKRKNLGFSVKLALIQKVSDEFFRALKNTVEDYSKKDKYMNIDSTIKRAEKRFGELRLSSRTIQNSETLKNDVLKMYDTIWNDPGKSKQILEWRKAKFVKWKKDNESMVKKDPPIYTAKNYPPRPLPDGNDMVILSTAANQAKSRHVNLFTFDRDFTIFAEEIKEYFDVNIIDGFKNR